MARRAATAGDRRAALRGLDRRATPSPRLAIAAPPTLLLRDIRLQRGPAALLEGAGFAVAPGERLALVGRNGSGKSTLLRLAAGLLEADAGERFLQPGARLRILSQEPDLGGFATAGAYVEAGLESPADAHRAARAMAALGVDPDSDPATLSGGEARRAALARVLAPAPDVLLLDEPTNHLDLPTIGWLEAELARSRSAIVLVSHDRRFLEAVAQGVLWLEGGTIRRMDGGFSGFEAWRDAILEEEATARHKLDRQVAREEDWLRYGVTARRKRNVRRVAQLADLRARRREAFATRSGPRMEAAEAGGSGTLVIDAKGISKAFGETPVVRDLELRVLRGDRIGLVGANGAGKSTLLGLLTGGLAPDAGTVRLGSGLRMVTLDQLRTGLDPATTVTTALTGGSGDTVQVGDAKRHVIGYLKDFLFHPDQARLPVGALSGGERARLLLARALATPSNLMVLDEPTNDLDFETLDLVEALLADYAGTLLVVSHDRDFLDRTATAVLVAEGEGRWVEYAGGYQDMVAQRGRGLEAVEAPTPAVRSAAPAPRAREPRATFGFAEQQALAALPARMEALAADIARLEAALADPTLYARDPARFGRFSTALEAKRSDLEAAEEQWLALELRRETMG